MSATPGERLSAIENELKHIIGERETIVKITEQHLTASAEQQRRHQEMLLEMNKENAEANSKMLAEAMKLMTAETNRWVSGFRWFITSVFIAVTSFFASSKVGDFVIDSLKRAFFK